MTQDLKQIVEKEEWRPVVGYEGAYVISSLGRVKRLPVPYINKRLKLAWHKEAIIAPYIMRGYHRVCLYRSGVCKHERLHRLIAQAFIPNPHSKPHINHIDSNKLNNSIGNLEWCTPLENVRHSIASGTFAIGAGKPVKLTNITTGECMEFKSIAEAAEAVGSSSDNLSRAARIEGSAVCGFRVERIVPVKRAS